MTGRDEVYIRPFPNVDSTRVIVSVDGGWSPRWAHSDDELFFVSGDGELMAARLQIEPELRVLAREPLFALGGELWIPSDYGDDFYDVALDDQAFLMARRTGAGSDVGRSVLVVVHNVFPELERRTSR